MAKRITLGGETSGTVGALGKSLRRNQHPIAPYPDTEATTAHALLNHRSFFFDVGWTSLGSWSGWLRRSRGGRSAGPSRFQRSCLRSTRSSGRRPPTRTACCARRGWPAARQRRRRPPRWAARPLPLGRRWQVSSDGHSTSWPLVRGSVIPPFPALPAVGTAPVGRTQDWQHKLHGACLFPWSCGPRQPRPAARRVDGRRALQASATT